MKTGMFFGYGVQRVPALVLIDMQRWMFRTEERAAQLPGLLPRLTTLGAAFATTRWPVYEVITVHRADRSTWSRLMLRHDLACLIEDTADVEPVAGYRPPETAVVVTKTANSAFIGTSFEALLRAASVTELVLAGAFIDGCVGLTAADAAQRGFDVTLVDDAIAHVRVELRAPLMDWLVEDYELAIISTAEVQQRLGTGPYPAAGSRRGDD